MKHRGLDYSISDVGNRKWAWTVHSKAGQAISGQVYGNQGDAILVAQAAIDRELAGASLQVTAN